jgi:hypothetical protein
MSLCVAGDHATGRVNGLLPRRSRRVASSGSNGRGQSSFQPACPFKRVSRLLGIWRGHRRERKLWLRRIATTQSGRTWTARFKADTSVHSARWEREARAARASSRRAQDRPTTAGTPTPMSVRNPGTAGARPVRWVTPGTRRLSPDRVEAPGRCPDGGSIVLKRRSRTWPW